ncbi:unnamed protein product [Moneuplotes crassus]|uniref:Uncharacterized protein n=1 Tax=Euplotes crassus TaxID=5936 RepID=A0AAD1XGN4_EUPCR|nr:unnamed protein product [Moneuplotes crassus]
MVSSIISNCNSSQGNLESTLSEYRKHKVREAILYDNLHKSMQIVDQLDNFPIKSKGIQGMSRIYNHIRDKITDDTQDMAEVGCSGIF